MIRRNQHILTQIYAFCDYFIIQFSFSIAWLIKFKTNWLGFDEHLTFEQYFIWNLIYGAIAVFIGFFMNFYSPKRKKRFSFEAFKIIQIQIISFLVLLSLLFINKQVHISREYLAVALVICVLLLCSYRYSVKNILKRMREKGFNKQFILILGAGSLGRRFYMNLQHYPEMGFEVVGFLDDFHTEHDEPYQNYKPILGKTMDLEDSIKKYVIDEVIIALPLAAHDKYGKIIAVCEKAGVRTLIIPDFYDFLPARPHFDNFAGIPLINVRDIPLDELGNRILKRLFDIVFSLTIIIVSMPLMLLIALAIKITSKGPIIFKQERVGLNRRTFHIYKFRTMRVMVGIESDTQWTTFDDPRKTKLGSLLRRTSLDEIPQFINVLLGDMSVVGPRPERPFFVEQFKEEIPKYMVKHHIRPGITGWAQTNGLRGDTSIEDRINHDLFYIENWSFLLDLKIIIKTVFIGFINRNAY